jgi:iron(III) transport system substrate-binding protein
MSDSARIPLAQTDEGSVYIEHRKLNGFVHLRDRPMKSRIALATGFAVLVGIDCRQDSPARSGPGPHAAVAVYTSVDESFARQVLDEFTKSAGIRVEAIFDSEAGKTTGLVNRIRIEKDRPRADVFWSGELFNTLLLARDGLLEPWGAGGGPPRAKDIPERYRDPQGRWFAVGLRARVLAFDPKRISSAQLPRNLADLARPEFASQLAIANPLFGTTHGHIAAMLALWGESQTREFLSALHAHRTVIVDGNSAAVREVINAQVRFCLTDTDDVWGAQQNGASLELSYIDLGDGGTLLIPTSMGLIAGCPHREPARQLLDFLASAETERLLYRSASRNIPVRASLRSELGVELPPETRVPYDRIAEQMEAAARLTREILLR